MGLDIIAHRKLQQVTTIFDADSAPVDPQTGQARHDWFRLHINPDYQDRARDIAGDVAYSSEETFMFHAGSYGGYNRWRDQLAEMVGWPRGTYEQYGRSWDSFAASA